MPTPTPTPVPAVEGAATLKIAAPYRLVANAANTGLAGGLTIDIAGQHIEEVFTGREIWQASKMVGAAIVLEFKGIPMSRQVFDAGAQGAARNVAGKLIFTTILGTRVAIVTAKTATLGMYALDDYIVMVAGAKAADTKPLLTSVIKANKQRSAPEDDRRTDPAHRSSRPALYDHVVIATVSGGAALAPEPPCGATRSRLCTGRRLVGSKESHRGVSLRINCSRSWTRS